MILILKRWRSRPVAFLLAAVSLALPLAGSGCGGGDGEKGTGVGGKDTDTGALAEMKQTALEAQKNAEAVEAQTYDKERYDMALSYMRSAESAMERNEVERARAFYRNAAREFGQARTRAEGIKRSFSEKIAPLQKRIPEVKEKAEKAEAPEYAAQVFQTAMDKVKEAEVHIEARRLEDARSCLLFAITLFQDSVAQAEEGKKLKARADLEKTAMLERKQQAKDAEADTKAAGRWDYAAQQEREADTHYAEKNYQSALEFYQWARAGYVSALATVKGVDVASIPGYEKVNPPTGTAPGPGPSMPTIPPPGTEGPAGTPGVVEPIEPGGRTPDATVDKINEILSRGMEKLIMSEHEFNPVTGMIMVDAKEGGVFRRDTLVLDPPDPLTQQKYLAFEERPDMVGAGFSKTPYSIAGNTKGLVLFKGVFKNKARITFKMNLQLAGGDSRFYVHLMSDGKNYYASNFGAELRVMDDLKGEPQIIPSRVAKFRSHANNWFTKFAPHIIKVEYVYSEEQKTGKLRCYYDDLLTCEVDTSFRTRGMVGFEWYKTKFVLQDLVIEGELDKSWAYDQIEGAAGKKAGKKDDFQF